MSKLEALKLSIQHWKRMIRYMKEHREEPASDVAMLESLGEFWSAEHCALCGEYGHLLCHGCPIFYRDKTVRGCPPSYHKFRRSMIPVIKNIKNPSAFTYPKWEAGLVHAKSVLRRLQKAYKKAKEEQ